MKFVIKLGTGVLTKGIGELDENVIANICQNVKYLMDNGIEVVIVSSGAVGLGMGKLGFTKRPKKISDLQMCAAVGQGILIDIWSKLFAKYDLSVAQVLITREDVVNRNRCNALGDLIENIVKKGVVPIINENDSISAVEIKFGDNDVLSALVSVLIKADMLALLSTAPGLIDTLETQKVIPVIKELDKRILSMAKGTTSATAVGGMLTKLNAANIVMHCGCQMFIGDGSKKDILKDIFQSKDVGTYFLKSKKTVGGRKRWIAFFKNAVSVVKVDNGAKEALLKNGSSLLFAGVIDVSCNFNISDVIEVQDEQGILIAKGLAKNSYEFLLDNKNNLEAKKDVIIHRDDLVLL